MKERFPIFDHHPNLVYLDSAATAHKPREVIEAISSFYAQHYGTVHRAIYRSAAHATERYNQSRDCAARFLNASQSEEIVFTKGTTDAINLIARSWGKTHLKEGDEILLTEMEHHSNIVPWQLIAKETGATVRFCPIQPDGTVDLVAAISPKTKIVSVAHMSNVTGTIHPIREIAKAAHAVGAILVVDGAQAAPRMPVDVQDLDCDFYAFSSHKCYGPTGVGVLYGKKHLLEACPPRDGGGDMIRRVGLEETTFADAPLRFEAGTPHIGGVIALEAALSFIESIGREEIWRHEAALHRDLERGLRSIPNLRILGEAPSKGPIATFAIDGVHPLDLATLLDLRHIAIRTGHLCAQPCLRAYLLETASRASLGIYNTRSDVEFFLAQLQKSLKSL